MRKSGNLLILNLLAALFCVLLAGMLHDKGQFIRMQQETVGSGEFRKNFYAPSMFKEKDYLSKECRQMVEDVKAEVDYFPVPASSVDESLTVSFVDSWMGERNYKGKAGHEGTDIMAERDERGLYPVLSMTDGTVTNIGWLEKGGYRIGITSLSGTYYYYAHLDSYGNLKEGDKVQAGEPLGYMGDSGYGKEGTKGQFAVHLHVGIYSYKTGEEISVNPYYVLRSLEKKKLIYSYS